MKRGDIYIAPGGESATYLGCVNSVDNKRHLRAFENFRYGLMLLEDEYVQAFYVKAKTDPEVEGQERMDI